MNVARKLYAVRVTTSHSASLGERRNLTSLLIARPLSCGPERHSVPRLKREGDRTSGIPPPAKTSRNVLVSSELVAVGAQVRTLLD